MEASYSSSGPRQNDKAPRNSTVPRPHHTSCAACPVWRGQGEVGGLCLPVRRRLLSVARAFPVSMHRWCLSAVRLTVCLLWCGERATVPCWLAPTPAPTSTAWLAEACRVGGLWWPCGLESRWCAVQPTLESSGPSMTTYCSLLSPGKGQVPGFFSFCQ